MTVYLLYHHDQRDYYPTIPTDIGVYSTRELALDIAKALRDIEQFEGNLPGEPDIDVGFHIAEFVVDMLPEVRP